MVVSRDQVSKQSREELRGLVAGVRQQFSQESKQYAAICAKMEAQLDEVRKIRDGVESVQQSLPQAIDQQLEKSVAAVMERLQTRVEDEITAQAQRHTEQFNRQLAALDAQAGGAVREKLREELERHQAQFLDQINKRMEEARTVEGGVRQQANQMLAQLSAQLDNFVTRRQQELSAQLEQQGRELLEAATRAVPKMEEQIGTGLLERLRADLDQRRTQLQQSPVVTGAETAPVHEPTEKVQEGGDQVTSTPDVLVRRREPKQDVQEVQKVTPQEAVRPDYVKVASTGEIAPDQGKVVEVDGKKILLFNIDGKFSALSNACPHRGGPLSAGEWEGDEVTCPWHGSKFKITTGEVLCPPATQGVKSFPVRITGKDLEVKIE
jgi:nitrite reductase/ring-hydroxylating ferredoxin subunit